MPVEVIPRAEITGQGDEFCRSRESTPVRPMNRRLDMDTTTALREIDHRYNDGIDVWLHWRPEDDRAIVSVADAKTGDSFTLEVRPDQRALDVFHHPFVYAGERAASAAPSEALTPS
jgi:hypothetical protein